MGLCSRILNGGKRQDAGFQWNAIPEGNHIGVHSVVFGAFTQLQDAPVLCLLCGGCGPPECTVCRASNDRAWPIG